jgi:hypothetical protein
MIIFLESLYAATIYMTHSRIVVYVGKPDLSTFAPRKVTKISVGRYYCVAPPAVRGGQADYQ